MIIFEPRLENYQFSQLRWIFFLYTATLYTYSLFPCLIKTKGKVFVLLDVFFFFSILDMDVAVNNVLYLFFLQSVIFHVESHPDHVWFKQCVTFNFFPTPTHELVYNLFNMIAMYGLPLIIITLSYTLILKEISRKTRQSKGTI